MPKKSEIWKDKVFNTDEGSWIKADCSCLIKLENIDKV